MKSEAIIAALSLLLLAGCDSQQQREKLRQDEDALKTTEIKQARDLTDKIHAATVEQASTVLGDHASFVLMQCYEDGFDNIIGDDMKTHDNPKLGPKYVATCKKITDALDRRNAADNKRHQKEISR